MKKNLTSEEILNLSKEDFIEYMRTCKEEELNSLSEIEDPNYAGYSIDEKIGFWSERLNRGMRIQAESGLDEYIMYTPLWHKTMKRIEPDFDIIIDKFFEKFMLYKWY